MGGGVERYNYKNNGFTLAELLAVIAILGIVALIIFPAVNKAIKSSKEKAYNQQIESILRSAESWGLENMSQLSDDGNNYITIEELKESGYLETKKVINPLTDEEMTGCVIVYYDNTYNQYIYNYNESDCSELSTEPIITLNGESTVTIGIGETYTDQGATALYKEEDITSSIVVTSVVDTTTVGTYTVRYNVTYNGKSAKEITRTVKVIDNSPTITLKGDSTVTIRLNGTYTDAGATAKTYEGTDITSSIVVTNDVDTTTVGTYTVRYNVTYNGKSAKEVTRTVKVVDKSPIIVLSAYETSTYQKSVTIDVTVTPYTGNTISTLVYKLNGGTEQTVNNNQIVIDTEGDNTIEVIAIDNEGNTGTITSGVYKIDTTSPTITFAEGDSAGITLKVSEVASYDLKTGVTVTDNNTITLDNVTVSGSLSAIIGDYTITYTATDEAGNTSTKTRKVTVKSDATNVADKMESSSQVATKDPDGNLRYVGSNPNNYVSFNGELWRIIGVFDGQTKIIRNEYYSTSIEWDESYNNWAEADLQATLNGTYLSGIQTNDPISYNYIDLAHVWYLGGATSASDTWTRANMYNLERGTTVYSGRPTTWTGAIGLMYPSDYGYSTSSTSSNCDVTMFNWDDYSDCYNNSWLYDSNYRQWTLTPNSSLKHFGFVVFGEEGIVDGYEYDLSYVYNTFAAKPALYLKSDVGIIDGTGDSEDPYILSM